MAWSGVWLQQKVHGLGFFSFMVLALVPRYPPIEFENLTQKIFIISFFFHFSSWHNWCYKGDILVSTLSVLCLPFAILALPGHNRLVP